MIKRRAAVLLNTRTGKTFAGVLWRRGARYWRLRNARLIEGRTETPLDGEVVLERANVDFYQELR